MKNIDSDLIRGNIDTIILKTMLDGDKYGLDIIKEVETKSNGTYNLKQPTLYSCLKRLENQELISSYWLDSDIGGKRHYYKLTDKGREFYQQKQEEWSMSKFIIDNLLSNYNNDEYRLVKKDDYDKIIEGKTFEYDENAAKSNQAENLNSNDEIEEVDEIESEEESELSADDESEEIETAEDDDDFGIDEYESLLNSEDEEDESDDEYDETDETEENEEFEEAEDDYPVYFNLGEDSAETEEQTTMQEENKSASESNMLARLRQQQNEEINTYYGDKNSYINHLNINEDEETESDESEDEVVAVQQNLLDGVDNSDEDEFLDKVNKFTEAAYDWQNFNSEGETTEAEDEFIIPELKETEITSSDDEEEIVEDDFNETNIAIENFNSVNEEELENEQFEDDETNEVEEIEYNDVSETEIEDDFFDDLDKLNNLSRSTFIKSDDGSEYDKTDVDEKIENFTQSETYEEDNDLDISSDEVSDYDNNFDEEIVETETVNEYPANDFSEFDNIINHNADTYSQTTMFADYNNPLFEPIQQRMTETVTETKTTETTSAKDIETLKTDFAKQGIIIKEYKKSSQAEETKNYLLANKINMVCSLILLCGFVFILSATYVILRGTNLAAMTGFSFLPFLYGMIPFAVWAIYHTVKYFISPYKKVPAKYSPLVTLFISLIITVQLLLITYCFNLQLGFYSFSQASYNHLLWIIPTIISFAPIVSNLIYIGLFYSQNFNV